MNRILISYDLRGYERNYQGLYRRLARCGPSIKVTESTWVIATRYTPERICRFLSNALDENDTLFVCGMGRWAAWGLPIDIGDWLDR